MNATDFFLWTDDLSVCVQEVDEQHKGIICLINRLHVAILHKHGRDTEREIFNQLVENTRIHFLLEESLMRLTHYKGFEVHKNQHEGLMDEIRTLTGHLDNGSATMNAELAAFLKSWLTDHIESCDRHFSAHFEKSGLNPYAKWTNETSQAMDSKPGWWKFW